MLRRFSLYGFLKNQRYFEDWWLLAFMAKGISFTTWGLLIGFRELMVNLMEIPSGAIADLCGRRKSMILSFVAYIVSFVIFGAATYLPLLFLGMAFFAVGDAFRTGTHKAMIFTWLRLEGRAEERTKTYGYTRSWSKLGSALCVLIAGAFVFISQRFEYTFYFAVIPYLLGIINFLGYPRELDGEIDAGKRVSLKEVVVHLADSLRDAARKADLRRLVFESMGFEGVFKAAKDYLQPILMAAAAVWLGAFVVTEGLSKPQKTVLLASPVFFVLYLLSAAASRNAHRLVDEPGEEDRSARLLWGLDLVAYAALILAMFCGYRVPVILGFVALYVMQNFWRPVLISRFDAHSHHTKKATILSIESQAKSVSTMIVAPILGLAIDLVKARGMCPEGGEFWPIGVLGTLVALGFFLTARRALTRKDDATPQDSSG